MDVYIYFPQLDMPRDVIEDALEECLGDSGMVTGAGSVDRGANLDVLVFSNADSSAILDELRQVLKELDVSRDTYLVIAGNRQNLYEAATD